MGGSERKSEEILNVAVSNYSKQPAAGFFRVNRGYPSLPEDNLNGVEGKIATAKRIDEETVKIIINEMINEDSIKEVIELLRDQYKKDVKTFELDLDSLQKNQKSELIDSIQDFFNRAQINDVTIMFNRGISYSESSRSNAYKPEPAIASSEEKDKIADTFEVITAGKRYFVKIDNHGVANTKHFSSKDLVQVFIFGDESDTENDLNGLGASALLSKILKENVSRISNNPNGIQVIVDLHEFITSSIYDGLDTSKRLQIPVNEENGDTCLTRELGDNPPLNIVFVNGTFFKISYTLQEGGFYKASYHELKVSLLSSSGRQIFDKYRIAALNAFCKVIIENTTSLDEFWDRLSMIAERVGYQIEIEEKSKIAAKHRGVAVYNIDRLPEASRTTNHIQNPVLVEA